MSSTQWFPDDEAVHPSILTFDIDLRLGSGLLNCLPSPRPLDSCSLLYTFFFLGGGGVTYGTGVRGW